MRIHIFEGKGDCLVIGAAIADPATNKKDSLP